MKLSILTVALGIAAVSVSCKPSARSNADTAVASDSAMMPALPSGPMDSVSQIAPAAQGGASTTATRKTSAGTSSTRKTKTTGTSSKAPSESGIIGRDSVIRFPHRALPTVSSTPPRK
ncbi:MAG TPA: hypothetical protein VE110_02845 [Gemmatimonadaceae bacterium]|nr:hypothetical protein [Gemmatimonadaceae bacterium]